MVSYRTSICAAGLLGLLTASIAAAGFGTTGSAFVDLYEICVGASQGKNQVEVNFLAENAAAMTKMMANMAITPAGDVDQDFADMMIAHHQGAIEMARAQLRYGRNEQLKRMAQEIIVTQQQEIAAMQLAVGRKVRFVERSGAILARTPSP